MKYSWRYSKDTKYWYYETEKGGVGTVKKTPNGSYVAIGMHRVTTAQTLKEAKALVEADSK